MAGMNEQGHECRLGDEGSVCFQLKVARLRCFELKCNRGFLK